jgi:release factor glutamine methyltransferase
VGAGPWDVILANLPYIPTMALPSAPDPASYEPTLALDGGPDGLSIIDRLLERLPTALDHGGVAMLEIGADQWPAIVDHVRQQLPGWACTVESDLGGSPRVVIVRRAVG